MVSEIVWGLGSITKYFEGNRQNICHHAGYKKYRKKPTLLRQATNYGLGVFLKLKYRPVTYNRTILSVKQSLTQLPLWLPHRRVCTIPYFINSFMGLPVFPLGKGELRKVATVEAMSEMFTGWEDLPAGTVQPYQCIGACES